jgi:hypothetical protein
VLHFDITITFRSEDDHAVLKNKLMSSIEDLKIVIDEIDLLLTNQHQDHVIAFEEARTRFSISLRKSIYRQLAAFVSSYVIKKIDEQYKLLIDQSTVLFACTHVFIFTMRLSCAHKIQKRMWKIECLLVENVHSHWR